jgi:hypothetical protein
MGDKLGCAKVGLPNRAINSSVCIGKGSLASGKLWSRRSW